jgi:tripartite-type tricarboxylate transporter receptor subunit TctC
LEYKEEGMKMKKAFLVAVLLLTAILAFGSVPGWAQYPTKPIELITPYGPGGESDLSARSLASVAHGYLGQPVVVINRGGAGGAIACAQIKSTKPDGYTLLLARIGSNAVLPALNPNLPYKYDDFTMIALLEVNPYLIAVNAESDIKTLEDLADKLKSKPGTLSYSTSGPGTILNMGVQLFISLIGEKKDAATMIPYKSGSEAAAALLGGHVDFIGINSTPVLGHIQGGKLRALAVTTEERIGELPDVPTFKELGYPDMGVALGWSALFGPPGMSDEVLGVLTKAMDGIKNDKTWISLAKKLGAVPMVLGPEETKKFVDKQFQTYRKMGEELDLLVK